VRALRASRTPGSEETRSGIHVVLRQRGYDGSRQLPSAACTAAAARAFASNTTHFRRTSSMIKKCPSHVPPGVTRRSGSLAG